MPRGLTRLGAVAVLAVALAACGAPAAGPRPDLTLHLDHDVMLQPFDYCGGGGECATPADGGTYVDAGSLTHVDFSFPDDGWTFTAQLIQDTGRCRKRTFSAVVSSEGDDDFRIEPAGPAATYDTVVRGQGPDGTQASYGFSWETPSAGPVPEHVTGTLAVFYPFDERPSGRAELHLANLATQPRHATATVTITRAAGDGFTVALAQRVGGCVDPGTLWLRSKGIRAPADWDIDDGPFTYAVVLDLDGSTYRAHASWSSDDRTIPGPLIWDVEPPVFTVDRRVAGR